MIMKKIGITQRIDYIENYGERRDCLDRRWHELAKDMDFMIIPLPNVEANEVQNLLNVLQLDGVILSGGNTIKKIDNEAKDSAPERDNFESELISIAVKLNIPVLGVCRGMQMINLCLGGSLTKVGGHVGSKHNLKIDSEYKDFILDSVNSYHNWTIGKNDLAEVLNPIAFDKNDNVECFIHKEKSIVGIMWHPEREEVFAEEDKKLIRKFLL